MKTLCLSVLCAALAGAGALLSRAEPAPPPAKGKVLVLDNERTLEGDIERVGDQYRVRRSVGETWLAADRALRLCASNEEALAFLRTRANLDDADERLRLAQWCRERGLGDQALAEVRAAAQLRPEHAETRRLLAHLEQAAALRKPAAPPPEPAEPTPALNVALSAEAASHFVTKVQPILMNSCASCHATGRGGAFRLLRAYDGGNRKVTQTNLAAVLAEVNAGAPQASPFLAKAASVHGEMAQAPFKSRQAAAYRALEDWVCRTVAANPQLRDALPQPPPQPTPGAAGFGEERGASGQADAKGPTYRPAEPALPAQPVPVTVPQQAMPEPQQAAPQPPDPYDPAEFNRGGQPPKP
jgi:hypothetical protein